MPHAYPAGFDSAARLQLRRQLDSLGPVVSNVNAFTLFACGDTYHPTWIEDDARLRDLRIAHTLASIELAHEIGSKTISLQPGGPLIPARIIDRPPTAELRENQLDTDSLPPYDVLDPILEAFIEDDRSVDEIVGMGFDRTVVTRVLELVKRSEYKRRQAPPGVRVSGRAFGRDWRYPITSGYRPGES